MPTYSFKRYRRSPRNYLGQWWRANWFDWQSGVWS